MYATGRHFWHVINIPEQIYRQHENEKKRRYAWRVVEMGQGIFPPLIFTTTGEMSKAEWNGFQGSFAELLALKRGDYASRLSWLWVNVSFAILTLALHCLKESRSRRTNVDFCARQIYRFIILSKIFFLFIGREPTTWPANNCLQIMVCSCTMPSNYVWLQIIFCTCVKETVLFSFLR